MSTYGRVSYNPVHDQSSSDSGPAMSLKILLVSMVGLVLLMLLAALMQLYVRWVWVGYEWGRAIDVQDPERIQEAAARGLDKGVLEALPTFAYTKKSMKESIECSVCISEFQENETGRLLPKCNHRFHTACIDMWFHSNSSCPLCRASVGEEPNSHEDFENVNVDEETGLQAAPSHDVTVELNYVPTTRNLAQEQISDDLLKKVLGVQETSSAHQAQHEDPHSNPHMKLERVNPSMQSPVNTLFDYGDQNLVSSRPSSRAERFKKSEQLVIEVPSRPAIYPSKSAIRTTPSTPTTISVHESETPPSHLKTIKRILSMRESWRSSVPATPKATYQLHQGITTP
ncbi:hypothetical protein O6H91_07G000600 [Diphasiastrum complanatum]|uniref:Uncharacterized protein n=1 Tax=Diphasiastrum complanatum TaxID=34168 RepID=A0ACC2D1G7_DIPCM|nr:hypothetical protein O6H91_07G000600 [Diphasiastrum complanatum]